MPDKIERPRESTVADQRGLLSRSRPVLKDLFATWAVIGSVMTALATIALIVRFGAIDWPPVLWGALRDYYALIRFLAGLVVPRNWPAWSADALNVYLWMAVAIYMRGFSRFGPTSPSSAWSRGIWLVADIAASALWPVTLLVTLAYGIVLVWIAVAAVIAITTIAIQVTAILATPFAGYRPPDAPLSVPKLTSIIIPVVKHVFGAVAKAFATTAILVIIFLLFFAALGAATTGLVAPPKGAPSAKSSG